MSNTTLLLDTAQWDLVIDAFSNIAMASPPYALAQDAASEIRTFKGEVWYDTTHGVPFFSAVFGQAPPLTLLKAQFTAAALNVPGVVSAKCFISGLKHRQVTGQVQTTDGSGQVSTVAF